MIKLSQSYTWKHIFLFNTAVKNDKDKVFWRIIIIIIMYCIYIPLIPSTKRFTIIITQTDHWFCHSTSCTSKQGHTVDIWDIRQRQQQLVDQLNSLRQPPKEHCKGCLVHRDLQPTRRHPLAYWQYRSTVYSLVPITARWTGSLREGKTSITRCHWWGSNPRPLARQPNALPARPPTLTYPLIRKYPILHSKKTT